MFCRSGQTVAVSNDVSLHPTDMVEAALEAEQACTDLDILLGDVDVLCGVFRAVSSYGTTPAMLPVVESNLQQLKLTTAVGACMEVLSPGDSALEGVWDNIKDKMAEWSKGVLAVLSSIGRYIASVCTKMADSVRSTLTAIKKKITDGAGVDGDASVSHSLRALMIAKAAILAIAGVVGFVWGRGLPVSRTATKAVMAKATSMTGDALKGAATVSTSTTGVVTIVAIKEAPKSAAAYGWTKQTVVQALSGIGDNLKRLPSALSSKFSAAVQAIKKSNAAQIVAATESATATADNAHSAREATAGIKGLVGFTVRVSLGALRAVWSIVGGFLKELPGILVAFTRNTLAVG